MSEGCGRYGANTALDALAAYRLTRLVTTDKITAPIRDRLHGPAGELARCSWCTSMYAAALVVLMRRKAPSLWNPIATTLALSAVTGLIADNA